MKTRKATHLDAISDSPFNQRLAFITFLLHYKGRLSRNELVKRFSCGEATASRTITEYLELYPDSMELINTRSGYRALDSPPVPADSALKGLRYCAFGSIEQDFDSEPHGYSVESLLRPICPDIVGLITRAIINKTSVEISYASGSSGPTERILSPHTLFKSGDNWYYRAYDSRSDSFRMFKFSRTIHAAVSDNTSPFKERTKYFDDEWNRYRSIELRPHPKRQQDDALLMDLGIKDCERKTLVVSEACVGYVLNELRVDCSTQHKLDPYEFPLALVNRKELDRVDSMTIAPGFEKN